jgi:hypothetical protein
VHERLFASIRRTRTRAALGRGPFVGSCNRRLVELAGDDLNAFMRPIFEEAGISQRFSPWVVEDPEIPDELFPKT